MDTLIADSLRDLSLVPALSLTEMIVALVVSAALCGILARVYIYTHSGHSYSRSFVHTQIFVGVTIALIMIIIGSNIARAFALVGALSIIRFRNPVKDSRDVAFIFMAMAIGMASGTKFYLFAAIFTAFISSLVVLMHHFRFGESGVGFYALRLRMPGRFRDQVEIALSDLCKDFSMVSIDRLAGESEMNDLIYEVNLNKGVAYEAIVERIYGISDRISVAVLVGDSDVNV